MGLETERLHFQKIKVRQHEQGKSLSLEDGESFSDHAQSSAGGIADEIALPRVYEEFFTPMFNAGQTLQESLFNLYLKGRLFRFKDVFRYLEFLAEHRLVKGGMLYEWLERVRPEYQWRENFLRRAFFEEDILDEKAGRSYPTFGGILLSAIAAINVLLLFRMGSLLSSAFSIREIWNFAPALNLGLFILSTSLAFTIKTLIQWLLLKSLFGYSGRIRLSFSMLSFQIASDEISSLKGKSLMQPLCALLLPLTIFYPAFLFHLLGFGSDVLRISLLATFLILMFEISPFVRSSLTDFLRSIYNYWDASGKGPEDQEMWIARFHMTMKLIWLALAVGFIYALLGAESTAIHYHLVNGYWHQSLQALLYAVVWMIIFLSWAEDVYNSLSYGSDPDRSFIRRIWLRKPKSSPSFFNFPSAAASSADDSAARPSDSFAARPITSFGAHADASFSSPSEGSFAAPSDGSFNTHTNDGSFYAHSSDGSLNTHSNYTSNAALEERLGSLPFLRQLGLDLRKKLLSSSTTLTVERGTRICRQGSFGRDLFILINGRAAVVRRNDQGKKEVVTFLEPGSVFGEAGFFLGKARTADVVTTESSQILVLRHRPEYQRLEGEKGEQLRYRIWFLQALISSPLFRSVPSEAMDQILYAGEVRKFEKGAVVVREGSLGDCCYVIFQGRARVLHGTKEINKMGKGDLFGEIALMSPRSQRTATVVAESELLVVELTRDLFWNILTHNIALGIQVERNAVQRFRQHTPSPT